MAPVVGDPPMTGPAPPGRPRPPSPMRSGPAGLERAVGEIAVVADGHPQTGRRRSRRPGRGPASSAPSPRRTAPPRSGPANGNRTKTYTSAASEDGRLSAITGLAPLTSPSVLGVDAGAVLVVVTLGGLSSVVGCAVARSRGVVHRGPGRSQPSLPGRVGHPLLLVPRARAANPSFGGLCRAGRSRCSTAATRLARTCRRPRFRGTWNTSLRVDPEVLG